METQQATIITTAKRPLFLTILCVLSFVGVAYSLINGIAGYFVYSAAAKANDLTAEATGMDGSSMQALASQAMDLLGIDPSTMALTSLIIALINIPVLIGVLFIWKLKKIGFYIYAASELVQAVIPFILLGGVAGGITGLMNSIIAILFIVLYGINLKHMY